jgi:hypothetical protein
MFVRACVVLVAVIAIAPQPPTWAVQGVAR